MKNSLPPFYIGQRVVALKTSFKRNGFQIIEGKTYTVKEQYQCAKCGKWVVGLAELSPINPDNWKSCCMDDCKLSCAGGNAKYFAPVVENFQSITLEKVLEEETKLISVN
jgi:hypothetical protein